MQSQLGDSQAMTHNSKFGQLLTNHKISGCLHTWRTTDYQQGNIPISRAYILSCLFQRKTPQILAKCSYVYNLDVLWHILPTQNTWHSVLLTSCVIKGKGHCVSMDRWSSSPKIFDHLWGCKTKAVGTVMSNKKEVPKQTFFRRTEKRRKISRQWYHL
jgi:hypothetical protein